MSDENLAPQEREWLANPEAAVREALRDTVGDGDGLDERVFDALISRAKAVALREAADWFTGGLHCADMRTTPEETVRDLRNRADQIMEDDDE